MLPILWCAGLLALAGAAAARAEPTRLSFESMPKGWDVKGVPGRAKAIFEGGYADGTNLVLRMTSDKATAALKSGKLNADLARTPIMRWRWKAVQLPDGVMPADDPPPALIPPRGAKTS